MSINFTCSQEPTLHQLILAKQLLVAEFDAKIKEKTEEAKNEIQTQHHHNFITQVGLEKLYMIPVASADTLGLNNQDKYHERSITPQMMGSLNLLRGLDGGNRPFIAIKVDLFDSKTDKKITQVVELVFKRHSIEQAGKNDALYGENYVTALRNLDDNGNEYSSGLYQTGGMDDQGFKKIGQLLEGKKVEHLNGSLYMQVA